MSKQLAISAAFSVFAMSAVAVLSTPNRLEDAALRNPAGATGAPLASGAPAFASQLPLLGR